jgi:oligoendopeptidase F
MSSFPTWALDTHFGPYPANVSDVLYRLMSEAKTPANRTHVVAEAQRLADHTNLLRLRDPGNRALYNASVELQQHLYALWQRLGLTSCDRARYPCPSLDLRPPHSIPLRLGTGERPAELAEEAAHALSESHRMYRLNRALDEVNLNPETVRRIEAAFTDHGAALVAEWAAFELKLNRRLPRLLWFRQRPPLPGLGTATYMSWEASSTLAVDGLRQVAPSWGDQAAAFMADGRFETTPPTVTRGACYCPSDQAGPFVLVAPELSPWDALLKGHEVGHAVHALHNLAKGRHNPTLVEAETAAFLGERGVMTALQASLDPQALALLELRRFALAVLQTWAGARFERAVGAHVEQHFHIEAAQATALWRDAVNSLYGTAFSDAVNPHGWVQRTHFYTHAPHYQMAYTVAALSVDAVWPNLGRGHTREAELSRLLEHGRLGWEGRLHVFGLPVYDRRFWETVLVNGFRTRLAKVRRLMKATP